MDNTSLESTFHWLSEHTVKFEDNVGFYKKFAKNITADTCTMDVLLHSAAGRCHGDDHGCQLIVGGHCQM